MKLKPLPQTFDSVILSDQLFKTLQRSKQTKHLLNLRAQQIVKQILFDSLQSQVYRKYEQTVYQKNESVQRCERLQSQIEKIKEKEQKRKKVLLKSHKSENQQILIKVNAQLEEKDQVIASLESQMESLAQNYGNLQLQNQTLAKQIANKQETITQLQNNHQQVELQLIQSNQTIKMLEQQVQKLIRNHQQKMQKSYTKQKLNQNTLKDMQVQINKLKEEKTQIYSQLQTSKQQWTDKQKLINSQKQKILKQSHLKIQKLKKELKKSEQNYELLKKEIQKFKGKYKKFQHQYSGFKNANQNEEKEQIQLIEQHNKEIQLITTKNIQLSKENQHSKKEMQIYKNKYFQLKNNCMRKIGTVLNSVQALKQENLILKKQVSEKVNIVHEYCQGSVSKVVNHISTQLSEQFQQCVFEIKKARQERNLAKQEAKIKDQIIDHLDKLLGNEAKSVYELRNQLRMKRKQEEKLRKKLKSHYEQADKKLQTFQKKYISILNNEL